jgi:3-oxoacyl-[acyl-carrier-protein] synthase-1
MNPVYAIAATAISPLGTTTEAHWQAIAQGQSGIGLHENAALSPMPFWGAQIAATAKAAMQEQGKNAGLLTPFEQMAFASARQAINQLNIKLPLSETLFILATTKGNIDLLGKIPDEKIALYHSAACIAAALHMPHVPVVVSHACISGVVALQTGLRLLQAKHYKHAVITGCDLLCQFIISGFQSFQAIAPEPCKPFDANRKGLNLGEASATIILSTEPADQPLGILCGGAASNDANHISGPSRTGAELALAIRRTLHRAHVLPQQVDMISAHGTATLYNDEMEAQAFALAGLLHAPVHSLKGYTGHTLGAAGMLESVLVLESLQRQMLIPSIGYEQIGVSQPLNITQTMQPADIQFALKTASGFGGCNAAILWSAAR